jgi:hypothetical protein
MARVPTRLDAFAVFVAMEMFMFAMFADARLACHVGRGVSPCCCVAIALGWAASVPSAGRIVWRVCAALAGSADVARVAVAAGCIIVALLLCARVETAGTAFSIGLATVALAETLMFAARTFASPAAVAAATAWGMFVLFSRAGRVEAPDASLPMTMVAVVFAVWACVGCVLAGPAVAIQH